ncbi:hypothetical protein ES703_75139 [subsurface metagenome]
MAEIPPMKVTKSRQASNLTWGLDDTRWRGERTLPRTYLGAKTRAEMVGARRSALTIVREPLPDMSARSLAIASISLCISKASPSFNFILPAAIRS